MTCLKIASFLQEDPSWLKAISMAGRKLEAYSWREWLREWKYRVDSIEVWSCCYVKIIPFICGFLECDNFPELDFCCFGNNRAGYELCAMAGGGEEGVFADESGRQHPEVGDWLQGLWVSMSWVRTDVFFDLQGKNLWNHPWGIPALWYNECWT